MTLHTTRSNDRGVSEAIGFMLIFGIVIAGIGLVTLYGYPLLLQQQVSADEKIMEKNMIVLQNDIKSLAYKTVPFKETSLKIGGGSLTVYNSSNTPALSTITIRNGSALPPYVDKFTSGDLRYESASAQTDISVQNGAVVMRPRVQMGSTMIAEPRWFYDEPTNTMVINLINITSTHIMAKEGIGTVQMSLNGTPEYYSYPEPNSTVLYLEYDTTDSKQDYSVAWDNYFTKTLNMNPPTIVGSKRTYILPTDTNRPVTLIIKKFEVEIKSI
jgi:hypothetical protein